ncbi:ribosome biogenesis regulatory protein-domain-containing protein [Cantharellus anzutake]|uniref:ribosome biogenesis regulatory protein-domain-containing protein n=1 Tax=Cantharellus anzutake TaxID=1750568 RepID=UPI00190692D7|nr:ribosome biogenesis regulatory protein-domain-containing protein [Cantharellus anzutake]KAF8339043.1 ribosome biogenesis regulatory protein-domain-containing protein [Cantharellus anzutake]
MSVEVIVPVEATKPVELEKESSVQVDPGLLSATDPNPVDAEAYNADREAYLSELAREGTQAIFQSLFSLPTKQSPDGPLAQLPNPTTLLPRAKPLPKPKPPTKWEQFVAAKGIRQRRKESKVWDDNKQDWVRRWGRGGKNKEKEEQWLHEIPDGAPDDYDPVAIARQERKGRVQKNERQRLANIARAERAQRKTQIEKTLVHAKKSTASMGKFDKKLEGEPTQRGAKRKFKSNEITAAEEKDASLALLSRLEKGGGLAKKSKTVHAQGPDGENVLNVRKAIRFASKGGGAAALAKESPRRNGKSNGNTKGKRK